MKKKLYILLVHLLMPRRLHLADYIEPWLRRFYGRRLLPRAK